ncbi:MAG: calycin-like domain-containing protein [Muribaculum sp.]|nr:calycin-like domain-containing protein [Muribaculum sp.]
MKKIWNAVVALALILSGACVMTSCDDDDDDKPNGGNISDIIGIYNGGITAKVVPPMGNAIDCIIDGTYDLSIMREQGEDDEVTVVIPGCSYSTENMPRVETIPELVIRDVDVDRTGHLADKYILEEDDFVVTVDGVTYVGSIYGTVTGSDVNLTYQVTPGKMPMPINFNFTGKRK